MNDSRVVHLLEEVKNPNQAIQRASLLAILAPMALRAPSPKPAFNLPAIARRWMEHMSPRRQVLFLTSTVIRITLVQTCLVSGFSNSQTAWRHVDHGTYTEASERTSIHDYESTCRLYKFSSSIERLGLICLHSHL